LKHVYLLQSCRFSERRYVGVTSDLKRRLEEHNAGKSPHTAKYLPWKIVVAIRFENDCRALDCRRYLKTGSGHAFAERHFWSNSGESFLEACSRTQIE
jgi:putative endonuclease